MPILTESLSQRTHVAVGQALRGRIAYLERLKLKCELTGERWQLEDLLEDARLAIVLMGFRLPQGAEYARMVETEGNA